MSIFDTLNASGRYGSASSKGSFPSFMPPLDSFLAGIDSPLTIMPPADSYLADESDENLGFTNIEQRVWNILSPYVSKTFAESPIWAHRAINDYLEKFIEVQLKGSFAFSMLDKWSAEQLWDNMGIDERTKFQEWPTILNYIASILPAYGPLPPLDYVAPPVVVAPDTIAPVDAFEVVVPETEVIEEVIPTVPEAVEVPPATIAPDGTIILPQLWTTPEGKTIELPPIQLMEGGGMIQVLGPPSFTIEKKPVFKIGLPVKVGNDYFTWYAYSDREPTTPVFVGEELEKIVFDAFDPEFTSELQESTDEDLGKIGISTILGGLGGITSLIGGLFSRKSSGTQNIPDSELMAADMAKQAIVKAPQMGGTTGGLLDQLMKMLPGILGTSSGMNAQTTTSLQSVGNTYSRVNNGTAMVAPSDAAAQQSAAIIQNGKGMAAGDARNTYVRTEASAIGIPPVGQAMMVDNVNGKNDLSVMAPSGALKFSENVKEAETGLLKTELIEAKKKNEAVPGQLRKKIKRLYDPETVLEGLGNLHEQDDELGAIEDVAFTETGEAIDQWLWDEDKPIPAGTKMEVKEDAQDKKLTAEYHGLVQELRELVRNNDSELDKIKTLIAVQPGDRRAFLENKYNEGKNWSESAKEDIRKVGDLDDDSSLSSPTLLVLGLAGAIAFISSQASNWAQEYEKNKAIRLMAEGKLSQSQMESAIQQRSAAEGGGISVFGGIPNWFWFVGAGVGAILTYNYLRKKSIL